LTGGFFREDALECQNEAVISRGGRGVKTCVSAKRTGFVSMRKQGLSY
jgi:hypothetical protein